jgi:hypothetical protein
LTIIVILAKILSMRRLFSAWLLCILAFGLVLTGAYSVSAQKVLESRLEPKCVQDLLAIGAPLDNKGNYLNIFDISSNLPFTPSSCAKDKAGTDPKDKYTSTAGTSAIPVQYFPFILIRVYKFMISLAFYLFGLGLLVLGVTIQVGVFNGNYDFERKIRTYFSRSITGLATVLFAYYAVAIILWIFNVDNVILSAEILPPPTPPKP